MRINKTIHIRSLRDGDGCIPWKWAFHQRLQIFSCVWLGKCDESQPQNWHVKMSSDPIYSLWDSRIRPSVPMTIKPGSICKLLLSDLFYRPNQCVESYLQVEESFLRSSLFSESHTELVVRGKTVQIGGINLLENVIVPLRNLCSSLSNPN